MWKREGIAPLFHIILYIFLNSGIKLHINLLNVVFRFIVFFTSATLICRGTDISKCFRESLGIRDNENRLYIIFWDMSLLSPFLFLNLFASLFFFIIVNAVLILSLFSCAKIGGHSVRYLDFVSFSTVSLTLLENLRG